MGIRKQGEAIQIREKRFGYFPQRFRWHGREYVVSRVERCWTVKRRRWGGKVEQLCFRVHCDESAYDIIQDVIGNTWHIQSARG
jgi:hypothetical protein